MPKVELDAARSVVRDALDQPGELSDDDVAALQTLHDDIERLLERTAEVPHPEHAEVKERSENLVERFERTHPKITAVLGSLADALSRMGI